MRTTKGIDVMWALVGHLSGPGLLKGSKGTTLTCGTAAPSAVSAGNTTWDNRAQDSGDKVDADLTSSSGSADGACGLRAHFLGSAELSWLFGVLRPARHSMWSENCGAFERI